MAPVACKNSRPGRRRGVNTSGCGRSADGLGGRRGTYLSCERDFLEKIPRVNKKLG